MKKSVHIEKVLFLLSIIIFVISLTQHAYRTDYLGKSDITGWFALFFGTIGVTLGGACLSWIANPLLILSWIFVKKNKYSIASSFLALIFSLLFMLFNQIIADEAGHYANIIQYKLGYWLWLLSITIMCISNVYIFIKTKNVDLHSS